MELRSRFVSGPRVAALFVLTFVLSLTATAIAIAAVPLPGNPLTVHVGDKGQLQAFRSGDPTGIFFAPEAQEGDAGFFLAFPGAAPVVYGFDGSAGPSGLTGYSPVSQPPTTG